MEADTAAEKTEKPADKKDWLASHITHLSALKAPTDAQKLLLLLATKTRTAAEERTFSAIVKSEKAQERAKKAQAEVASLLATEAAAERKARTHKLIQLGLLFSYAGIEDAPREFLAGLAAFGLKTDDSMKHQVMALGADLLATKEPKKAPAAAPAPAAPAAAQAPRPVPAAAVAPDRAPAPAAAATRTYLTTTIAEKDVVKALGARWDAEQQKWYVPPGAETRPFAQWIR